VLTNQQIDTLNNPAISDLPIPAHIVYEKCDGISLALKLISSIIPLAYICIELLPLITSALAGAVYSNQLVDDIRDMWSKPELIKDSIFGICISTISKHIIGILAHHI